MNKSTYQHLCRQTSIALQFDDVEALGAARPVDLDEVEIEAHHTENGFFELALFFEVGEVEPENRLEAYEAVLALQLHWAGESNGMFVLDVADDRLMFCVSLHTLASTDSELFAGILKAYVQQIREWRSTVLAGGLAMEWMPQDPAANMSTIAI